MVFSEVFLVQWELLTYSNKCLAFSYCAFFDAATLGGCQRCAFYQKTRPVLLHVIVLCQLWLHRLHKPHAFPQSSFIYEISYLFTFCPYAINVPDSSWKCVTALVKIRVKILLHVSIRVRKAALVRSVITSVSKAPCSPLSLSFWDFWPNKCRRSF